MSSALSRSSSSNSSPLSRSAYDVTDFLARPDALPFVAGVDVLDVRPVAFFGVAFGVSTVFSTTFLTGSLRLGLFDFAKKSDVVVSSSSGVGSRFCFLGAGFLDVAFFGLAAVSLSLRRHSANGAV